jgi:hypothetical protein
MRRLANKPLLGGWIVFGSSLLGRSKRARKRAFVGLGRFSRPRSAWRPPAKFREFVAASMLDTILASPERIASIILAGVQTIFRWAQNSP